MGSALLHRPVLHSVGHHIGHAGVKAFAVLYGLFQGPVGFLGKPGFITWSLNTMEPNNSGTLAVSVEFHASLVPPNVGI